MTEYKSESPLYPPYVGRPVPIVVGKLTPWQADVDRVVRDLVVFKSDPILDSGTEQLVNGTKYVYNYKVGQDIQQVTTIDHYQIGNENRTITYFNIGLNREVKIQLKILIYRIQELASVQNKGYPGAPHHINPLALTPEERDVDRSVRFVVNQIGKKSVLLGGTSQIVAGFLYKYLYETPQFHFIPVQIYDRPWENIRTISYVNEHGVLTSVEIPMFIYIGQAQKGAFPGQKVPIDPKNPTPSQQSAIDAARKYDPQVRNVKFDSGTQQVVKGVNYELFFREVTDLMAFKVIIYDREWENIRTISYMKGNLPVVITVPIHE